MPPHALHGLMFNNNMYTISWGILRIAACRRTLSVGRCSAMCFNIRNVADRVWTVVKT